MNKKLCVLYLSIILSLSRAQGIDQVSGWVPTKATAQCINSTNGNMTSLYLCIKKDNSYIENVISIKLKKINNPKGNIAWNKLKKEAELQCKKEITRDLNEEELNDGDLSTPDYLGSMYECIGDKYSDFNRQNLNLRVRRPREK
jgi:hypothetical protein